MPGSHMLPPPFQRQMQELLAPEAYAAFLAALNEPSPVSVRLNPAKMPGPTPPTLQPSNLQTFNLSPYNLQLSTFNLPPSDRVPWHPHAYYLPERPVFTLDPAFHAGAYYVQEASSMFLYEALRQTVDFSRPLRVLDLCAAPGGKSTLVVDMLNPAGPGSSGVFGPPPDPSPVGRGDALPRAPNVMPGLKAPLPVGKAPGPGLLVANEVIRPRTAILRENLEKWGSSNIAISCAEVEEYAALEDFFDVVVTDAPCSGEGLFRKDPDAVKEWSPAHVELCSGRQRRILAAAVAALKPGGVLVYSTCTYNRHENDDNSAWMVKAFELEPILLNLSAEWNIEATRGGYRFFPHRVRGEGFFIAVLQKKDGAPRRQNGASAFRQVKPLPKNLIPEAGRWLKPGVDVRFFQTAAGEVMALPAHLENDYLVLDKFLKAKWFGTSIGEFKGKDFVPSHSLALSNLVSPALPAIDLGRDQALLFLKKQTFDLPADAARGWALARYQGLNLGWMKVLPGRMNNYLPAERRIRMDL